MRFTHRNYELSNRNASRGSSSLGLTNGAAPADRNASAGWLARFAAEKRRWAIVSPVAAAVIVVVAAAGNQAVLGLAWYAIILSAKALELALVNRVLNDRPGRASRAALLGAEFVLCLGWAAAFLLFRANDVSYADLTAGLVMAMMASLQLASILRSRPQEQIATPTHAPRSPQVPSIAIADLANDFMQHSADDADARSISRKLVIEPHLPDLLGNRHQLQALIDAVGTALLRGQRQGSRFEMTATLPPCGGLRLTFSAAAVSITASADLARAEATARNLGATISLRHAKDTSTVVTLDFAASHTLLTTPVERRPLADPTAGQRLLMALTQ